MPDNAQRCLWHHCTNHLHTRGLSQLHKAATGVPKIKDSLDADHCDICLSCKARRSNKQHGNVSRATVPFAGISMDWGFICQKSKNKSHTASLTSRDRNRAYLIISDHTTPYLNGIYCGGKEAPIEYLNAWLQINNSKNKIPISKDS